MTLTKTKFCNSGFYLIQVVTKFSSSLRWRMENLNRLVTDMINEVCTRTFGVYWHLLSQHRTHRLGNDWLMKQQFARDSNHASQMIFQASIISCIKPTPSACATFKRLMLRGKILWFNLWSHFMSSFSFVPFNSKHVSISQAKDRKLISTWTKELHWLRNNNLASPIN